MSNATSRATVVCGLAPDIWVTVFMKETPYGQAIPGVANSEVDPGYRGHRVACHLEYPSEPHLMGLSYQQFVQMFGAAPVRLVVQESEDGVTWVNRYTHTEDLNPGGEVDFKTYHVARWVRLVAFSRATGLITCQVNELEDQVLPALIPSANPACSWCEVDCETGQAETTGIPAALDAPDISF